MFQWDITSRRFAENYVRHFQGLLIILTDTENCANIEAVCRRIYSEIFGCSQHSPSLYVLILIGRMSFVSAHAVCLNGDNLNLIII